MTDKTAKTVYIVWQLIFGIPAFGYIGRTIYRMATIPIPPGVDFISGMAGTMVAFALLIVVAIIGVIPSIWYDSRRINAKR